MDFDEYQEAASRTITDTQTRQHKLANFALGLCGEAGEVSEPIKKHLFHGKPLDAEALKLELGDCLWYLSGLCTALGIRLEDVAAANVAKLRARHPDGFKPAGGQVGVVLCDWCCNYTDEGLPISCTLPSTSSDGRCSYHQGCADREDYLAGHAPTPVCIAPGEAPCGLWKGYCQLHDCATAYGCNCPTVAP